MIDFLPTTEIETTKAEPTNEQLALQEQATEIGLDEWFLEGDNLADVCRHIRETAGESDNGSGRNKLLAYAGSIEILDDLAILAGDGDGTTGTRVLDASEADIKVLRMIQAAGAANELAAVPETDNRPKTWASRHMGRLAATVTASGTAAILTAAHMASAGAGVLIGTGVVSGISGIVEEIKGNKATKAARETAELHAQAIEPYAEQLADRLSNIVSAEKTLIPVADITVDLGDSEFKQPVYERYAQVIKAEREYLKRNRYHLRKRDRTKLVFKPASEIAEVLRNTADATERDDDLSLAAIWNDELRAVATELADATTDLEEYRKSAKVVNKIDDRRGAVREYKEAQKVYQLELRVRQTRVNLAVFAFLEAQQNIISRLQTHISRGGQPATNEPNPTWENLNGV